MSDEDDEAVHRDLAEHERPVVGEHLVERRCGRSATRRAGRRTTGPMRSDHHGSDRRPCDRCAVRRPRSMFVEPRREQRRAADHAAPMPPKPHMTTPASCWSRSAAAPLPVRRVPGRRGRASSSTPSAIAGSVADEHREHAGPRRERRPAPSAIHQNNAARGDEGDVLERVHRRVARPRRRTAPGGATARARPCCSDERDRGPGEPAPGRWSASACTRAHAGATVRRHRVGQRRASRR